MKKRSVSTFHSLRLPLKFKCKNLNRMHRGDIWGLLKSNKITAGELGQKTIIPSNTELVGSFYHFSFAGTSQLSSPEWGSLNLEVDVGANRDHSRKPKGWGAGKSLLKPRESARNLPSFLPSPFSPAQPSAAHKHALFWSRLEGVLLLLLF